MRKCCVLTCGACESDGVSLFHFPRNPRLNSKWIRMVNRDRSDISDSTVVCSRHFPEHLIGKKANPRLKTGAFPTLQLQGAPTASTRRKRLRSRAGPLKAPAISVRVAFSSEDADGLSSLHEHLNLDQATITVVKEEPEEILNTLTGESLLSEDYGGVSTIPPHLEDMDKTCLVKEEPEEFAATLGMEGEGETSEAFDSMPSLTVLLEGQRRDGSLHVIEVPDEILPTPTGGGFRSEDCNRVTGPQLDLEEHNNSYFVKQGKLDCTLPCHCQRNLIIIISCNE
ncbi:hypothetical protein HPB47_017840 [Ixodes persulcatus]|uniref:Uncharacterized protein n=1 Tax=Ixodes persulcatus TaxID=34615 RepID=A0AC60QM99_IXOPE|nr:hypothetical protein HPB47_017840 [Ixodes persulcatus]